MYIGIAGNIGSGKSAMAQLLMEEFNCELIDAGDKHNPYLQNCYANMNNWALNLQVYFLTKRFKAVQRAIWTDKLVVQDRTIYEDAYVFVENLYHMGILIRPDYDTYMELFQTMTSFVRPPDLLVYLKASVPSLLQHIRQRGLAFESAISPEYLTLLNARYDQWVSEYKNTILEIDIDGTDFVTKQEDRQKVVDAICSQQPLLKQFRIHK